MAETRGIERRTDTSCLSRRLAGLLLAGVAFASLPALAQERTARDQPTLTGPLADGTATDMSDANAEARPAVAATLPNGEQDVLAIDTEEEEAGRIRSEAERLNLREGSVDGLRTAGISGRDEPPGIRLGTFVLKPALSQGIAYEKTKTGGSATSRTFSQTGFKGTLTSDWSRHQLTIDAEGVYERNISGKGEPEPLFILGTDLRLDLADDTVANLTAGYSFQRESSTDPNAVEGASVQSGVHGFVGGARVTRDFGMIRGTIGADLKREAFGSATLANGDKLDLSDRNYTEGTLTGRVGFELSPALIPYLEASAGRSFYDHTRDSLGYQRSATTIGGRAGVEVDLGEKLRGDLGLGYKRATFDDSRLDAIDAVTVDGSVFWSPQRGTDLRLGLKTEIEPTVVAGQSGYVSYGATTELTHELRDNLVARLTGVYTWRDFPKAIGPDQNVYLVGAGLTWDINRWLAMTGDVSYELTTQPASPDTGITRAGIGLVVRR